VVRRFNCDFPSGDDPSRVQGSIAAPVGAIPVLIEKKGLIALLRLPALVSDLPKKAMASHRRARHAHLLEQGFYILL